MLLVQLNALNVDVTTLQSRVVHSRYPCIFLMLIRLNVLVVPEKRGIEDTLWSGWLKFLWAVHMVYHYFNDFKGMPWKFIKLNCFVTLKPKIGIAASVCWLLWLLPDGFHVLISIWEPCRTLQPRGSAFIFIYFYSVTFRTNQYFNSVCCLLQGTVGCACMYCVALTCSFRLYFLCMHTVTIFHHACLCQSTFSPFQWRLLHANFKTFDFLKYLCMRRNCD